jgi:hypothetical protein
MGTIAFFVFLFFSGLLQWLVIDGIWENAGVDKGNIEDIPEAQAKEPPASSVVCAPPRELATK